MAGLVRPGLHAVLRHLHFARHWLERAENEFSQADSDRAELTLSLAEAEMREAWEASRRVRGSSLDLMETGAPHAQVAVGQVAVHGWQAGLLGAVVLSALLVLNVHPARAPVKEMATGGLSKALQADTPMKAPDAPQAVADIAHTSETASAASNASQVRTGDTVMTAKVEATGPLSSGHADDTGSARSLEVNEPVRLEPTAAQVVTASDAAHEIQAPTVKPIPVRETPRAVEPAVTGQIEQPIRVAEAPSQPDHAAKPGTAVSSPEPSIQVDLIELFKAAEKSLYQK